MDGAEKLQKWPQKTFKRPQKPYKKASGEATGDHGGSRRLKEGLLESKNHPRKPAGGQDFSKKPFWCHSGVHFGGLFWHMFGSKIKSKFGSVFDLVFCSVLVPKSDPTRTRKPSTWHQEAQKSAKMTSKTPRIRRYSALLKSYKNAVIYNSFGPPSRPRASQNGPKRA